MRLDPTSAQDATATKIGLHHILSWPTGGMPHSMEKREKREEKSKKGFCTSQKFFEYRKTSENMVLSLEKIEPIVENT